MKKIKKIYIIMPIIFALSVIIFIFGITDTSAREEKPFTIAVCSGANYEGADFTKFAYAYKMARRDQFEVEFIYFNTAEEYEEGIGELFKTGDVPDVFWVYQDMYTKYANSPYFYDINNFFEADPEFKRSDCYENVLDAFQVGDKLPVIPFGFYQPFIAINHELADKTTPKLSELESVDMATIIKMYESLDDEYKERFYCWSGLDQDSAIYKSGYLDLRNQRAELQNDKFVDLLEKIMEYQFPPDVRKTSYFEYDYEDMYSLYFYDKAFVTDDDILPHTYLPLKVPYKDYKVTTNENHNFTARTPRFVLDRTPLATYDGRNYIEGANIAAVYSGSTKKDIAWDFIKYGLSEEINTVSPFLIFHNSLVRHINERVLRDTITAYASSYNGDVVTEEMRVDIEETAQFLLKSLEGPQFVYNYASISGTEEILGELEAETLSAYDAAVKMQRIVDIYFIEQD